jgi:hypothetical protein
MKPPVRSREDLEREAAKATAIFRRARSDEPLEHYSQFFDTFAPIFRELFVKLPDVTKGELDPATMPEMFKTKDLATAFRYLAAPPISADDLKILAESHLSRKALRADAAAAKRVRDTVLSLIDPHRFPWIKARRDPSPSELETAVIASAALVAAQKVQTQRRGDAKTEQEEAVKQALRDIQFAEVPPKEIGHLRDAPAPGQFCGESMFGDTRADLVVTLYDSRVMPIECKVSNSAVNSFKRLINEASGKARAWLTAYGDKSTMPAAVLSGVYGLDNLLTAQDRGLALFWAHDLGDLQNWIQATKETAD